MKLYIWYFFAYAFLGWCAEVVFAALKSGRFVNRGFLNGPICPIYGFGIVAVLFCLRPIQGNLLALYAGSVVLTTVLEWATGFLMEKLFHQRWWDYSNMPLNIGGYVCLPFSLVWGFACLLIVKLLHPLIAGSIALLPEALSTILLAVFAALFLTDVVLSAAKAFKLDRTLTQIDEAAAALRRISDKLGETMADGALAIKATDTYARDELQAANQRARIALNEVEKTRNELKAHYLELLERIGSEHNRLLAAFPHLRSIRHPAALEAVKEKLARFLENGGKRK